ncbi:MAG: hypothetical protein ACK4UJ_12255 [Leptonema sp. (in: bacteria)]
MYHSLRKFQLMSFVFIFLNFCKYYSNTFESVNELKSQSANEVKQEIVVSKKWNYLKNFLIGKADTTENGRIIEISQKSWYKQYTLKINDSIKNFDKRKEQIIQWHKENLKEVYQVKHAFYLLSGGDFFYFRLFYPEAENYFMFAMEKDGEFPEIDKIEENQLRENLFAIEKVIHNLSYNTYLFSKTMNQFLNQDKLYSIHGTLPIIIFFIGYFNGQIVDVKKECFEFSNRLCLTPGYSIQYIEENNKIKTVYYYSKKLVPQDANPNSSLDSLLNRYTNKGLFLKASIYLLHYQGYSKFAEYLLKNFQYIIQEDSGIPYRFIKQYGFKVQFYGRYIDTPKLTGQISPFQKDLNIDFSKDAKPLPFHFGYGTARQSGISNLIFAYKNL